MATVLVQGDLVMCPHCLRKQEDSPVEDFVVPNCVGEPCEEECCWCYETFSVTELGDGTYEVGK
jgi:hypothetical protein